MRDRSERGQAGHRRGQAGTGGGQLIRRKTGEWKGELPLARKSPARVTRLPPWCVDHPLGGTSTAPRPLCTSAALAGTLQLREPPAARWSGPGPPTRRSLPRPSSLNACPATNSHHAPRRAGPSLRRPRQTRLEGRMRGVCASFGLLKLCALTAGTVHGCLRTRHAQFASVYIQTRYP